MKPLIDSRKQLYKKCDAAPSEYRRLADSVLVLHGILEQTNVHLEEEGETLVDIPQTKKSALVVARLGCEAVLDEIDILLEKYPTLGSKGKAKLFERARFVTHDINTLKTRLEVNGDSLQRCLTSLMSVSLLEMKRVLSRIEHDYRNGNKEPSVLSHALIDGEVVDIDHALEQAERDLLDENVHPDSIDLHKNYVKAWVQKSVSSVDPDEDDPHELAGADGTEELRTLDSKHHLKQNALRVLDGEEDLYECCVIEGVSPRNKARQDEVKSPSQRKLSRTTSIDSHHSLPDTWHPSNERDPEYVAAMLSRVFTIGPMGKEVDIEEASFYFKRAFHQQDCYKRGFLTRSEVLAMCRETIRRRNVAMEEEHLIRLIHEGDQSKRGRLELEPYLTIMHNIMGWFFKRVETHLYDTFYHVAEVAEVAARERREQNPTKYLPWGFKRKAGPPYFDEIEQREVQDQPPLLPSWTFSVMAEDVASYCISIIDEAESRWTKAGPSLEVRQQFHTALDKVCNAAIRFTLFYNPVDAAALSDLDEMVTVLHLVGEGEYSKDKADYLESLRSLQVRCYRLSRQIKGFAFRLQHRSPDDMDVNSTETWPTAQTFLVDSQLWEKTHMATWAEIIRTESEATFAEVEPAIEMCRDWYNRFIGSKATATTPSTQSLSHGCSPIDDQQRNVLTSRAVELAKGFSRLSRQWEKEGETALKSYGRPLSIEYISFDVSHRRSRFSRASKITLSLRFVGNGRSERVWNSPGSQLEALTPELSLTTPKWATALVLEISPCTGQMFTGFGARTKAFDFGLFDQDNFTSHSWLSDFGTFTFDAKLENDMVLSYGPDPCPWLDMTQSAYDLRLVSTDMDGTESISICVE